MKKATEAISHHHGHRLEMFTNYQLLLSPELRIIETQNTPEIENISHPLISLCHCTQRPQKCKQMQPLSTLAPLNCSNFQRIIEIWISQLCLQIWLLPLSWFEVAQSVKSKSQVTIGWSCLLHIPSTTGVRSLFVMRYNTLSFLWCGTSAQYSLYRWTTSKGHLSS